MSEQDFVFETSGDITPELVNKLSEQFDVESFARHQMGAKKYGPVKFLEVDSLEEAVQEVLDIANYARYTYIKLRMLQVSLATQVPGPVPTLGKDSFANPYKGV